MPASVLHVHHWCCIGFSKSKLRTRSLVCINNHHTPPHAYILPQVAPSCMYRQGAGCVAAGERRYLRQETSSQACTGADMICAADPRSQCFSDIHFIFRNYWTCAFSATCFDLIVSENPTSMSGRAIRYACHGSYLALSHI